MLALIDYNVMTMSWYADDIVIVYDNVIVNTVKGMVIVL